MEFEKKKIQLYQVRQFGDKLSDTFAFFGENYKKLLKYASVVILPVALLMGWAMNNYLLAALNLNAVAQKGMDDFGWLWSFAGSVVGLVLSAMIGYVLLTAAVYALMRLYESREERLRGITWTELKPLFIVLLKRCGKLILAGLALGLAFGLLIALFAFLVSLGFDKGITALLTLVVAYLFVLVVCFPLMLWTPIYLFEDDITLMEALRKALRLGFRTWGGIFGVMLVLGLVVGFINSIMSMPWTIAMAAKAIFTMEEGSGGFVDSFGFSLMVYLLSVVQSFVSLLCYSIPLIGLAYQYGHAVKKYEDVPSEDSIFTS